MTNEKIINKYIAAFFILAIGSFLMAGLIQFFNSFLGAVVFYTLFKRFMYYLSRKKKLKKSLSAVIIIIISFIIVVLPIGILCSMIFNKIVAIAQDQEMLNHYNSVMLQKINNLPFKINAGNLTERVQLFIADNAGRVLNSSLLILGNILMMYFFLFFLLINMNRMEAGIIHYLPFKRSRVLIFGRELVDQTYSNAIGIPLVCIAQGLCAYLSYRIAQVPEAGLWGILTGFASIIPLVGTAIIWLPVTLYLLAAGQQWQGIFVGAYSIVIMSNVDNLIRMIVSKKIGDVHPVITVLGVIFGLKYFGIPGLVFGPLLISYFLILLKLYYVEYNRKPIRTLPIQKAEGSLLQTFLNRINLFITSHSQGPSL